jgi:hypothetical protein
LDNTYFKKKNTITIIKSDHNLLFLIVELTYDKIKKEICCSYYPSYFFAVFVASLGIGIAMLNQQAEKEVKRLFTNSKDISETRYSVN